MLPLLSLVLHIAHQLASDQRDTAAGCQQKEQPRNGRMGLIKADLERTASFDSNDEIYTSTGHLNPNLTG